MNYEVTLSPRAERDLNRFRGRIYLRLQTAIDALANDPRPPGCLKMTTSSEWRIRVGVYRIRYLINDTTREVTVTRVGHRRDVYDVS
jgi:mRNA interferase RelE/StbE